MEKTKAWAEASHIERLRSEPQLEHDHCTQVERNRKLQPSSYKALNIQFQHRSKPHTEEPEEEKWY